MTQFGATVLIIIIRILHNHLSGHHIHKSRVFLPICSDVSQVPTSPVHSSYSTNMY